MVLEASAGRVTGGNRNYLVIAQKGYPYAQTKDPPAGVPNRSQGGRGLKVSRKERHLVPPGRFPGER